MATALVASVALGLSVDDTFHCLLQFRRERQTQSFRESLFASYSVTGPGVLLSSLAVAVGFVAVAAQRVHPVRQFRHDGRHRDGRQHPRQPRSPARLPDPGRSGGTMVSAQVARPSGGIVDSVGASSDARRVADGEAPSVRPFRTVQTREAGRVAKHETDARMGGVGVGVRRPDVRGRMSSPVAPD